MSSGSLWVYEAAKEAFEMDYAFGNVFETASTQWFTGEAWYPVVDGYFKAELVQMLAMQERISVEIIVLGHVRVVQQKSSSHEVTDYDHNLTF